MSCSFPQFVAALAVAVLIHSAPAFSQSASLHYLVEATLNDREHRLTGTIVLHYANVSTDTLASLVFHVPPNAYASRSTAYAQHQLDLRRTDFHFADPEHLGGYDSLSFWTDGTPLEHQQFGGHADILEVTLQKPLQPGDSIRLEIPYSLRIPRLFSHFGHIENYYQMVSWYPMPAPRDTSGHWDARPTTELSDIPALPADFDVSITLPANYIVAAAGRLESLDERAFLEERIRFTEQKLDEGFPPENDFIQSSAVMKTVRYSASHVPSFSWSASKDLYVLEEYGGQDSIRCQAFFSNRSILFWRKAARHLANSVTFFESLLGPCPYPTLVTIESRKQGSFAFDQPMISFIGDASSDEELDRLIAYETAKQWFLGRSTCNNHWLLQGLGACYESRYMEGRYVSGQDLDRGTNLSSLDQNMADEAAYLFLARQKEDRAPAIDENPVSAIGYSVSSQVKPAIGLKLLEAWLGEEVIDSAVRLSISSEQGLCPENLKVQLERIGLKNTNWFFEDLMRGTQRVDYRISRVKRDANGTDVVILNNGGLALPFQLAVIDDGRVVYNKWVEGTGAEWSGRVPIASYDKIEIDPQYLLPDLYRPNNSRLGADLANRLRPPLIRFLSGFDQENRRSLFWAPVVGWNNYEKSMAGVVLYNRAILPRKLEWAVAPLLGGFFDRLELVGVGEINWHHFKPTPALQRISPGLGIRSFSTGYLPDEGISLRYVRLCPKLQIELAHSAGSETRQTIEFRLLSVSQEAAQFSDGSFTGTRMETQWIPQLEYVYEDRSLISPLTLKVLAEQQDIRVDGRPGNFIKLSADLTIKHFYQQKKSWGIRLFAGYFTSNTFRNDPTPIPQAFALAYQGFNDYTFSHHFIGRSESSGLWARQVALAEGGFKVAPLGLTGRSNRGVVAVNLSADLPLKLPVFLPLGAYLDLGYVDNPEMPLSEKLLWSGGLSLQFAREAIGIYLPVVNASAIHNSLHGTGNKGLLSRITFRLDFAKIHPWRVIDDLKL